VWALQEPLDRRVFRCDYSDVAVLGKAVARGSHWWTVGLLVHAANGAVFGLVYDELRRRTRAEPVRLAVALALAEHLALFPLVHVVDRVHPAGGEEGVPRLAGNRRAFAQATWRHALFGAVLGGLVARLDPSPTTPGAVG
jgi:hypothetical protein